MCPDSRPDIEGADGLEMCEMSAFRVSGLMQQNNPSWQIMDIGHMRAGDGARSRVITMRYRHSSVNTDLALIVTFYFGPIFYHGMTDLEIASSRGYNYSSGLSMAKSGMSRVSRH